MGKILELGPDLVEIVNFTAKHEPVAGLWVLHGLVAGRRQILDCQPSVSQRDTLTWIRNERQHMSPLIVWSAVGERPCTPHERSVNFRRPFANTTEDPAHNSNLA